MITARLLADAAERLRRSGVESPEHDARALLGWACRLPPSRLSPAAQIDPGTVERFSALIDQRARRVPLQHLTGRAYFRYVELEVGPGVFVPRPETEVMTGWAVDRLRAMLADGRRPVAVDLGTGSGAIAKSLAVEVSGASVHAVEISEPAADWAARNLHGTGVELHIGDMATALAELDGTVDLVAANPPYIPLDAYASVPAEVRDHDPPLALFSGADGLDAIKVVVEVAARLLRPGGLLCVEHADVQGEDVVAVGTASHAFAQVRDNPDLTGRSRFVTAVRVGQVLAGLAQ